MDNLEKTILFDTSSGTRNMGDYIIVEAVEKEMAYIFNNSFTVKFATHTPVCRWVEQDLKRKTVYTYSDSAKFKFIAGTNLIASNMLKKILNWNVTIFNYKPYKNSVLVGVGSAGKFTKVNWYTKMLYKKILSKEFIHSTRDEKTKVFLESIGLKAVNTGCVTLWGLTEDVCKEIPVKKSENVVCTLTDYRMDKEKDQRLIDILNKNYKQVSIWIQGAKDFEYFKSLKNTENIKVVGYNIKQYKEFLINNDVDYVGTRLHAGVYAMKHKRRAVILGVDNRLRDMSETYSLKAIERDDIERLEEIINSEFETKININFDMISKWKSQFKI